MGKLVVILLSILLAVGKFRSSAANNVLNMQRTLKNQRDKESTLPPCDRKKDDICHKDTKELYKGASGQCQKHACLFQPTVGLTQHPHTPYFKYNPSAIVSSAKTILYSFKGMEGEVCTYQKQPCSCRREDRCSCSSAAKICKQQYKVERTYFVVYNSGKKSYKSPFGAPGGHKPNMGFNPGYPQHQASPFGMGMMGMNPFQQSYGSHQQSSPSPTGLNVMGLGRSLVPKDNEDKKSNDNEGNKRNFGPFLPNTPPSTNPAMPFHSQSGDPEMQKLQALAQSLSMNQAPNGFPMGMMPPGPPSQGFGSYNPYQMPSSQGPASMPQQPSYPFPPNMPPPPMPQQGEFGNHPAQPGPASMPQQPSYPFPPNMPPPPMPQQGEFGNHPAQPGPASMPQQPSYPFPPNTPPQPMPQQSDFGYNQGQHPQGYPVNGPMPALFPPQSGPSPPHPSGSNEFPNYPNNPAQAYPPTNPTFPENSNPFQPETPPNTPSASGGFGPFNGQQPQGYPNAHQSTFNPVQSYPPQPQTNFPYSPNPYSPPYHQAPHSPPSQQYPPHHQPYGMGSQQPVSMYGNAMMTSAIFRYFLMQDKSSTTSNTFLKMLPILMSNSQISKMISFESLYVMVPDGCDCEQSDSNDNDDDPKQSIRHPFFNPYQYPSGMMPGYQMPNSPFPSFGAQPQMPFPGPYPGMNPSLGHPGMAPPPPPSSGNSAPWFMNYQIFKGKPSA